MSTLELTPHFSCAEAVEFAVDLFGLEPEDTRVLPSERDQNFLLINRAGERFVLKISDGAEERAFLEAQNAMLQHLGGRLQCCPELIPSTGGEWIVEVEGRQKQRHMARLVTYLEGETMAELAYHSPALLQALGECLGEMDVALKGFDHAAFHREFHWDLAVAHEVVRSRIGLVADNGQRRLIEYFTEQFEGCTAPLLRTLPRSVIHNDANDGNIVVAKRVTPGEPSTRIVGLIDFGDAVHSWTAGNLAVAVAYAMLGKSDPLAAACEIVSGYHSRRPLSEEEVESVFGLACVRLSVSAAMAAEQHRERPDDPYLTISQEPIKQVMPLLAKMPFGFAAAALRSACGLSPVRKHYAVCRWLEENRKRFEFPLGDGIKDEQLRVLDLGVGSHLLGSGEGNVSEELMTRAIQDELAAHNALVGVGRYLEPRLFYTTEAFAESDGWQDERRTVHLGMDLFAKAGSEVCAPLNGTVHLTAERADHLDYGYLLVLRHETAAGDTFFTLYGHLAKRSLDYLQVGQAVSAGEVIGWLGAPEENGGWTAHLHFQIVLDLLGLGHGFPGVGRASQIDVWRCLSPDPNRILGIPDRLISPTSMAREETLSVRRRFMGRNLSLSYSEPIQMVRGWMQYLYDDSGRRYLDAYNNVPHVGHCHPNVVRAAEQQLKLLSTNTRYLSEVRARFARRLADTMPGALDVCYFLNSASEANELALRLARASTGQKDLIVLADAYHGNTTTMIDISPYKHDSRGGCGAPEWVHKAPVADVYRGEYRDPETAGRSYAEQVGAILDRLEAVGRGICGFIAESCPSVGGQILFPRGYLQAVYAQVRARGGLCIADEVQTGYGRLGGAFYGFELQDVVPDIVVLGKPIGNGYPLAAVVTTTEIADAFDNGMEFFSTFGGNTVSAAVGLAVLEAVEQEALPAHAQDVGAKLLEKFRELKKHHAVIGDVRGAGFFLGLELIRDEKTLEPAGTEAAFVTNRMRERGVLLGVEGPANNVLKIRPPMPFSHDDARMLVDALDQTLTEL